MSTRREVWIVCNECGAQENTHTDSSPDARAIAVQKLGWLHPAFATDLCPECKETGRAAADT